jgi:hypothetical protein
MWGGFIDLESLQGRSWKTPFPDKSPIVQFAYGRHSLSYILQEEKPSAIHLPSYICNSVVEAVQSHSIPIHFYPIAADFTPILPKVGNQEQVLVVNYFGLLSEKWIHSLVAEYQHRLILDLTHAWFQVPPDSVWAFNSTRKFLGVPDGSVLWLPKHYRKEIQFPPNTPEYRHLIERSLGHPAEAYRIFSEYEERISVKPLLLQSDFSTRILQKTDFEAIANTRKSNYEKIQQALRPYNSLSLPQTHPGVAFAYPLLPHQPKKFETFHQQGIFIPQLWKEVVQRSPISDSQAITFSQQLLPIPLDQRYNSIQIQEMLDKLISILEK